MIDLHNHVLPGIDDGASNIAESLQICRVASQDGIEVIVATPHYLDSRRSRGSGSDSTFGHGAESNLAEPGRAREDSAWHGNSCGPGAAGTPPGRPCSHAE